MRYSFAENSSTITSRTRRVEIFAGEVVACRKQSVLTGGPSSSQHRNRSADSSPGDWTSCGLLHLDDPRGHGRRIISDFELHRVFSGGHKGQIEQHRSRRENSGRTILTPADIEGRQLWRYMQRTEGTSQDAFVHRSDRQGNRKRAIRRRLSVELPEQSDLPVASKLRPAMRARDCLVQIARKRWLSVDEQQIRNADPSGIERDFGES